MSKARAALIRERDQIMRLAALHGAGNVRVFGSLARGEDDNESDLNLLVDLEPGRSLLDLGGLLMDLRDLLQLPVDVFTAPMLKLRIREAVLREATQL